jgi:hypothetical protein
MVGATAAGILGNLRAAGAPLSSPAQRTRFQLRGLSGSDAHVCCKPELGGVGR